ncbi:hypothetical protein [Halomicrococcus gelatinilyticus]|uniref:hypothetical protein n=1 Tax=Halomicrococcus gelatinilyticus TaxID=1702103 RepID=UPI002E13C9F9
MSDEEILAELRTIRTLLALDKEEQLNGFVDNHSEIQNQILDGLSGDEWSSIPTSEIADEHDVSNEAVRRRIRDLMDDRLIERQGKGAATEYRKTGILRAAELVSTE